MRLIDADELKEKLLKERDAIPLTRTERYGLGVEFPNHHGQSMRGGIKKALRCMEQTPTIDAVEVVRCKDCEHCAERKSYISGVKQFICERIYDDHRVVEAEHYCSYGKRKETT